MLMYSQTRKTMPANILMKNDIIIRHGANFALLVLGVVSCNGQIEILTKRVDIGAIAPFCLNRNERVLHIGVNQ